MSDPLSYPFLRAILDLTLAVGLGKMEWATW